MQVYINEQGAVVRKKGGLLKITKGKHTIQELPLMQIEQLICVGNVQVTTQAAKHMVKQGIDVVFMTTTGTYNHRLDKSESKFAELRRQQVNLCDNPGRSLEIARQIIIGKINNQRVILHRRAQQDQRAAKALMGMLQLLKQVETARDIDQLRGFEGKAAAFYFDGVRTFFPETWGFTKRQYRPAPDPANALLSYAYTLLLKDVTARIHLVGLDPAFGFFHALENNRPALALDVMEEFRPIVCDAVVLTLVMDGLITLKDFEHTSERGLPVKLTKTAREILIEAYERRLSEKVFHPMVQGETELRNAIKYQAQQVRWLVEGKGQDYLPVPNQ